MRIRSQFKSSRSSPYRIPHDFVVTDLGLGRRFVISPWMQAETQALLIAGLSSVIRTRQWGVRQKSIEHCVWICLTPIPKKQCQLVLTKNALDGGCAGHQQARLFPLLCNNCNWFAVPAARFNNPSGFIAWNAGEPAGVRCKANQLGHRRIQRRNERPIMWFNIIPSANTVSSCCDQKRCWRRSHRYSLCVFHAAKQRS